MAPLTVTGSVPSPLYVTPAGSVLRHGQLSGGDDGGGPGGDGGDGGDGGGLGGDGGGGARSTTAGAWFTCSTTRAELPMDTPESICEALAASEQRVCIVARTPSESVVGTSILTPSTTLPARTVTVTAEASTPAAVATSWPMLDMTAGV